jgi:uncharacterized protein YcgI (DUF1989 family)
MVTIWGPRGGVARPRNALKQRLGLKYALVISMLMGSDAMDLTVFAASGLLERDKRVYSKPRKYLTADSFSDNEFKSTFRFERR